jgi:hypothetical protein
MAWSAILHVCADVIVGTDRGTGSNEPVGGMQDIKDAGCLLNYRLQWDSGAAVHCALVHGGRDSDCSNVLHKGMDGCGESWPGPIYEVCVIGVRNGVQGRVRSSDGLKSLLMRKCEEEVPEGSPWHKLHEPHQLRPFVITILTAVLHFSYPLHV